MFCNILTYFNLNVNLIQEIFISLTPKMLNIFNKKGGEPFDFPPFPNFKLFSYTAALRELNSRVLLCKRNFSFHDFILARIVGLMTG